MEPTKAKLTVIRPHYKALWESVVAANKRLNSEVDNALRALDQESLRSKTLMEMMAEQCTLTRRWATVAVIEALALIIVAIILLAR